MTARDELLASLRDLERTLVDAPSEMRPLVTQQLEAARQALALLDATRPAQTPAVMPDPARASLFEPEAPEPPPAWVEDGLTRDRLRPEHLRCPDGAAVYEHDGVVGCALRGEAGRSLSVPHGLRLHFSADGALARQELFERGALRWSVSYHPGGARESEGRYTGDEPKVYLEDGLHTRYARDGRVVAQCRWRAGRREGWQRLWEDDGRPIVATRFVDDREVERALP